MRLSLPKLSTVAAVKRAGKTSRQQQKTSRQQQKTNRQQQIAFASRSPQVPASSQPQPGPIPSRIQSAKETGVTTEEASTETVLDDEVDTTGTNLWLVTAYVEIDNEFVRVRWGDDPKNDSWEPTTHMQKELGKQSHDTFLDELSERTRASLYLYIVFLPTCKRNASVFLSLPVSLYPIG